MFRDKYSPLLTADTQLIQFKSEIISDAEIYIGEITDRTGLDEESEAKFELNDDQERKEVEDDGIYDQQFGDEANAEVWEVLLLFGNVPLLT